MRVKKQDQKLNQVQKKMMGIDLNIQKLGREWLVRLLALIFIFKVPTNMEKRVSKFWKIKLERKDHKMYIK